MNPHFRSFPTMYNTWGLRIQEDTEKQSENPKKMPVFLKISLPFFSITSAIFKYGTFNFGFERIVTLETVLHWKIAELLKFEVDVKFVGWDGRHKTDRMSQVAFN